jgi:peptidyl-prolyl cis-trans isomerase B (cyclophilin B)
VTLARTGFFTNTECHRLTTQSIYVLQCGDPSGTGQGGPGYQFQDENLNYFGAAGSSGTVTYKAGTVAMANSGPGTNGSQFFLVYKDSPLAPSYTPFGTITKGLDILQAISTQGSDNSNGTGDGKPKESVTIQSVSIS